MTDHPNVERLRAFLDAYASHDADAIRGALADEAVWHVGGKHRLSGDYRGADEIVGYFDRVAEETGGTLELVTLELLASERRGAAFLRVTGHRGDRALDVTMAEAFHFDGSGRIQEFWAHAANQVAVDEFWG